MATQKLWRSASPTKRDDDNSETAGMYSSGQDVGQSKPNGHLGVLLSTLLAERQRNIVSNVGSKALAVQPSPPARSKSAPGSWPSSPPSPTAETGSQATSPQPATRGVDRSQVGRIRRQVDELMEGIRPPLLAWIRSSV